MRRVERAGLRDIFEVRRAVEVEAARLAAVRRDDDDLERLRAALALAATAGLNDHGHHADLPPEEIDRFVEHDLAIHLGVAEAAHNAALLETYRSLGVPWVVTRKGGDISELREALAGRTSVLLGHSGVGKSTLVNALVPDAGREIGHVNAVTGRGRHTSTSALMLRLPEHDGHGGGWIVDTPGIRSFGLAHVEPEHLIGAFPDLDELTTDCPRGCTHGADEPECGLDEAVAEGRADPTRVESFRRLLEARSGTDY